MLHFEYVIHSCKDKLTAHKFSVLCLLLISISQAFGTYSHMCDNVHFKAQKHTIIRTEDSVANGAVVLRTLHTASTKDCEMTCCKLDDCTVAVFETTTRNLCYLFNCGRDAILCEFEHHTRYTANVKMNKVNKHSASSGLNVKAITLKPSPTVLTLQEHPDETDDRVGSNSGPSPSSRLSVKGALSSDGKLPVTAATGIRESIQPEPAADSVESVALAESYRQIRAAVLGLSVSLALTLIAIVVLGCRLRRLRARVARGGVGGKLRGRSVDDEDYLINGMYL